MSSMIDKNASDEWDTNGAYMCSKCGEQCNSARELHRHTLACAHCVESDGGNYVFNDTPAFIRQGKEFTRAFDPFYKPSEDVDMESALNQSDSMSSEPVERKEGVNLDEKSTVTVERRYACAECEKRFKSVQDLREHFVRVHLEEKTYRDKVYKFKESMKQLELTREIENRHVCAECNKVFDTLRDLHSHMLQHGDARKNVCTECNKRFECLSDLRIHMYIHTGDRPYPCTICNKRFNQLANLNAHKLIHSDERPHACSQCDKKFKRPDSLKAHELLHTDVRRFPCKDCNMRFARPQQLRKHVAIHDGNLLCTLCDTRFAKPSNLKQHMLTHFREEEFKNPIAHKLFHSNKRSHACSQCDKKFKRPYLLKMHELHHSGERTYACKDCDKRFTRPQHVRRHSVVHTNSASTTTNVS